MNYAELNKIDDKDQTTAGSPTKMKIKLELPIPTNKIYKIEIIRKNWTEITKYLLSSYEVSEEEVFDNEKNFEASITSKEG